MLKFISYIILLGISFYLFLNAGEGNDLFIELEFLVISLFSIFRLYKDENLPYSLQKVFYLFSFFFFGIAPWLQFRKDVKIWTLEPLIPDDYLVANFYILVFIFLFALIYDLCRGRNLYYREFVYREKYTFSIKGEVVLFLVSLSVLYVYSYINKFNIFSLFLRGGELIEDSQLSNMTLWLIVEVVLRPIPIFIALFYHLSKNKNLGVEVFLFLIGIIMAFPTAIARYQVAVLYIPIVILLIPLLSKKNIFVTSMIVGILTFFPFLNQFRNYKIGKSLSLSPDFSMFLEGHFDAYQNFLLVLKHDIVTYGKQLLGVFVFFVPRSLWEEKPTGSGFFLSEQLNLSFSNISMTFPAEGYINAGFIGFILFTVVLAVFCSRVDTVFWSKGERTIMGTIQYLVLLGMTFFILRGDLQSSFAYLIGILFSIYVVKFLVEKLSL